MEIKTNSNALVISEETEEELASEEFKIIQIVQHLTTVESRVLTKDSIKMRTMNQEFFL